MNQLKDDTICKYCLGCNKLENPNFIGCRRCNGFIPGYEDWQDKYYNENKGSKINFKRK